MRTGNQYGPSGYTPGSQRNPIRLKPSRPARLRSARALTTTGEHHFVEVAPDRWVPVGGRLTDAEHRALEAEVAGDAAIMAEAKSTDEVRALVPGFEIIGGIS